MTDERVWSISGDTDAGTKVLWEKLSQSHFPTTNAMWTVLGSNLDICGERLVTNCLKNGTAHMGRCSSSTEGNVTSTLLMEDPLLTLTACKCVTERSHKVLG